MRTWIISGWMAAGILFGQLPSNSRPVKVLTVCEVLGNLRLYADTVVAVLGRKESSVSLTDRSEFLSQDRCEHRVVTHGHTWSNKIQIWTALETGMPKPPSDKPALDQSVVAAKLTAIRKTTNVGSHQEPTFKAEGRTLAYTRTIEVPNEWAIVYGRIVKVLNLREGCRADDCGGDDVPLLIIAEPYNVRGLRSDGILLEDK